MEGVAVDDRWGVGVREGVRVAAAGGVEDGRGVGVAMAAVTGATVSSGSTVAVGTRGVPLQAATSVAIKSRLMNWAGRALGMD